MPFSFFLPVSNLEAHSTLLLSRVQHNLAPVPTAVTNSRTPLVLFPGITPHPLPPPITCIQVLISDSNFWVEPTLPKWPSGFTVCFTARIPLWFKGLNTCKFLNLFYSGRCKKELLMCDKQQVTNQSWQLRVSGVVIWVHILNLHCFLYNVGPDQKPPGSELVPWLQ